MCRPFLTVPIGSYAPVYKRFPEIRVVINVFTDKTRYLLRIINGPQENIERNQNVFTLCSLNDLRARVPFCISLLVL